MYFKDWLNRLEWDSFRELLGKGKLYYDLIEFKLEKAGPEAEGDRDLIIHIPVPLLLKGEYGIYLFDDIKALPITRFRDEYFFNCWNCGNSSFFQGLCYECYEEDNWGYSLPNAAQVERQKEHKEKEDIKTKLKEAIRERLGYTNIDQLAGGYQIYINDAKDMYWIQEVSYVVADRYGTIQAKLAEEEEDQRQKQYPMPSIVQE